MPPVVPLSPAQRAYIETFDRLIQSDIDVRLVRADMTARLADVRAERGADLAR